MGRSVSCLLFVSLYVYALYCKCYTDQRALGFSMRVERADVNKVKEKLESLKRTNAVISTAPAMTAVERYNDRIAISAAEEERAKRMKKERDAALKKEKEAADVETMDPEIAALMGFT